MCCIEGMSWTSSPHTLLTRMSGTSSRSRRPGAKFVSNCHRIANSPDMSDTEKRGTCFILLSSRAKPRDPAFADANHAASRHSHKTRLTPTPTPPNPSPEGAKENSPGRSPGRQSGRSPGNPRKKIQSPQRDPQERAKAIRKLHRSLPNRGVELPNRRFNFLFKSLMPSERSQTPFDRCRRFRVGPADSLFTDLGRLSHIRTQYRKVAQPI
jgi:hypothetical protein